MLQDVVLILLMVLVIIIFRNWYNFYKKRKYRKNSEQLQAALARTEKELLNNQKVQHDKILVEQKNKVLKQEIEILKNRLDQVDENFIETLYQKEEEINLHKQDFEYERRAYKKYADFKVVDANNTRLGAHFLKNVISHIYHDLESAEAKNCNENDAQVQKAKITLQKIPIRALKNIFALLDYNVATIKKEKVTLGEEISHMKIFLELIQYLKPKATIKVDYAIDTEETELLFIKPTLFFPFLENALKHGNLNGQYSSLFIEIRKTENNRLFYTVINSCEQEISETKKTISTSTFGLGALRELLDTYYPKSKLEHRLLPNKQYFSNLIISLD